jgi:hypothetical protein
MKQADSLASSGNHCAHNLQPPLPASDVEKLLADVGDFLVRHPLP